MSFSERLGQSEDILAGHEDQGTEITAALVIEVLREDFDPDEVQSAAKNWAMEYGIRRTSWIQAINAVAESGLAAA